MSEEDDALMSAIHQEADRAEAMKPAMADSLPIAERFHLDFPHRSVDEIREKIRDVWRARGLFTAD